jgi:hypothetical protein
MYYYYYNTKNQVLKKAETEHYKKALLGQGWFSRFDFVWLFANFGSSQKKRYRIIPILNSKK